MTLVTSSGALVESSKFRDTAGIREHEYQLICAYLQGAVYCWVKNRRGEWFAVRDLVGGENTDWRCTPLQPLYDRHVESGKTDKEAFEAAAKDIGWILKARLHGDSRKFELDNSGYANRYRWLSGEQS